MDCDCAVIGAGPAGLHTSTYLGRFRRSVVTFDGGKPRAGWIPKTFNLFASPEGVAGEELLGRVRRQAEMYGCRVIQEEVLAVEGDSDRFVIRSRGAEVRARRVVLATGVFDIPPEVPDALHYRGRTILHCPICDAYEATDRKLAVFGYSERAARVTLWLTNYTRDLVLLTMGHSASDEIPPALVDRLGQQGIDIIEEKVVRIQEQGEELGTVYFEDGRKLESLFRGYSAMGLKANSRLAADMGVELDTHGYIKTFEGQVTNRPGVYAVGDIVGGGLGQLAVAAAHAAVAATAIHSDLLTADGLFGPR